MKAKNLFLASAICLCLSNSTWSQTSQQSANSSFIPEKDNCKTKITQVGIDMENARDQNAYRLLLQQQNIPENVITEYTIQFHIVRKDDGTGGVSITTVRNEFTNWVNPY